MGFHFANTTDVIDKVGGSLGLAGYYWHIKDRNAFLGCGSFTILIASSSYTISLSDYKAEVAINDRIHKAIVEEDLTLNRTNEEKKKVLKP